MILCPSWLYVWTGSRGFVNWDMLRERVTEVFDEDMLEFATCSTEFVFSVVAASVLLFLP